MNHECTDRRLHWSLVMRRGNTCSAMTSVINEQKTSLVVYYQYPDVTWKWHNMVLGCFYYYLIHCFSAFVFHDFIFIPNLDLRFKMCKSILKCIISISISSEWTCTALHSRFLLYVSSCTELNPGLHAHAFIFPLRKLFRMHMKII